MIFPEGTRTRDFPVNACQPTAGLIARSSGVPVQTLLIEFSSPYLGKDWPLLRRPELPLAFRIRRGERFAPPKNAAAFATELERHFRTELAESAVDRSRRPLSDRHARRLHDAPRPHPQLQPRAAGSGDTVRAARAQWNPVWVVVDGSTDGTATQLQAMAAADDGLKVIVLPENRGKGAAVLAGITQAAALGYTHALTMDSDGQHPAELIPAFMAASMADPAAMVLGKPVFGPEAPALRVNGRKVSNGWANLETLWMGIGDSLYGFRVYPIAPLLKIMRRPTASCAASTSTPRPSSACAGPASGRSTSTRRCATCRPPRAAFRTSTTCATTCC